MTYAKYTAHTVMKSQLRIDWRTVSSHFIKSQLDTERKTEVKYKILQNKLVENLSGFMDLYT